MPTQVFAFAQVPEPVRDSIYSEIRNGKSRFGMWDQIDSLQKNWHGKNAILLKIKPDDWIVHVNFPSYGRCVAVQVTDGYQFDEGIVCDWDTSWESRKDFHNHIPVNPNTIVEFDRNDPNILPSVNLRPMRRAQRVLQVEDFLKSLENVKHQTFTGNSTELRGVVHLKAKMEENLLPTVTKQIQQMNHSKDFELFLHEIFQNMPNCESVKNGFGWRTDHGADLIVEFQTPIIGVNLTNKLIVQAKSYTGDHHELNAVDQIVEGIKEYKADGGLLITTANSTEKLEEYIRSKSEEIEKSIDLMAGSDVARFVIRHAPHLLIGSA